MSVCNRIPLMHLEPTSSPRPASYSLSISSTIFLGMMSVSTNIVPGLGGGGLFAPCRTPGIRHGRKGRDWHPSSLSRTILGPSSSPDINSLLIRLCVILTEFPEPLCHIRSSILLGSHCLHNILSLHISLYLFPWDDVSAIVVWRDFCGKAGVQFGVCSLRRLI